MENKMRTIEKILTPPAPHMVGNGFRVHNFFPHGGITQKRISPFLMLDYNSKVEFPPSETPRGVGVHPHKGFETVTIAYQGRVEHHDSGGNSGVISEKGVQWMTAGSGVLHKEYHEREFSKKGGLFQMVQLWVNLPKINKLTPPKYQDIPEEKMNKVQINAYSHADVIAGELDGVNGSATTFSPVNLFNLYLSKDTVYRFALPKEHNAALLVVEGSINMQDAENIPTDNFILMRNDGTEIELKATEDAIVLVMSGEPINEPIASYGPFVMNTTAELYEAIDEMNAGKFGVLED